MLLLMLKLLIIKLISFSKKYMSLVQVYITVMDHLIHMPHAIEYHPLCFLKSYSDTYVHLTDDPSTPKCIHSM